MNSTEMGSEFDTITTIKSLTVNNLSTISFKEMLEILEPLVLTAIPEDESEDSKRRLDFLLARCANLHAYLWFLWCHATNERARLKHVDSDRAELMQKKKEALYALAGAVKLKYEAASRKVTVALESEEQIPERADYEARRDRRDSKPGTAAKGGWGNIR